MSKTPTEFNAFLAFFAILIFLGLPGCVSREATQNLVKTVPKTLDSLHHILFQEKDTTDLMFQSARGDTVKVKQMLKGGADINEANVNGYTALMFAAEYGNLKISKLLVDRGANIHKKNKYSHTALYWAGLTKTQDQIRDIFEFKKSNYIGENNPRGVIDYLISIGTPMYESSEYTTDTARTAKAFFNIATMYEFNGNYTLAQQNYEVAMKNFYLASEQNNQRSAFSKEFSEAAERMASLNPLVGLGKAMLPVLQAANQRYQNRFQARQMADAASLRDAKKHNLDTQQFLDRRQEYLKALEETPNLSPAISTPYTAKVSKPKENASEGMDKVRAGITSDQNIYQLKSKKYYGQATSVGIILECYKNEIADESFPSCLEWAQSEFTYYESHGPKSLIP